MRGGGDGHDGGSPGGNDNSNDGGKGNDTGGLGGGNDGFGGGDNDNSGGGSDTGDTGRGMDSEAGSGRRGAATSAFGGVDDTSLAGTPGSSSTTKAGQSESTSTSASEQTGSPSESGRGIGGMLGSVSDSISQGFDSITGTIGDLANTAVTSVVGPAPSDLSKFGTGWHGAGNTSRANAGTRAALAGEEKARNQTKMEAVTDIAKAGIPGVNTLSLGLDVHREFDKAKMSPTEEKAYDRTREQRSDFSTLGKTIGGFIGGLPGMALTTVANVADLQKQEEYSKELHGRRDIKGTRRSSALDAFSDRPKQSELPNRGGLLTGSTHAANYWWQPASYGVGDYGRHRKKLTW